MLTNLTITYFATCLLLISGTLLVAIFYRIRSIERILKSNTAYLFIYLSSCLKLFLYRG